MCGPFLCTGFLGGLYRHGSTPYPKRHSHLFLYLAGLVVSGGLLGFKQQYLGLSPAEVVWLNSGFNARTHMLFGQLRCFSFYSDAAQFGAEMAGAALVVLIQTFDEKKWVNKGIYGALTLVYFWGYAISGTRMPCLSWLPDLVFICF